MLCYHQPLFLKAGSTVCNMLGSVIVCAEAVMANTDASRLPAPLWSLFVKYHPLQPGSMPEGGGMQPDELYNYLVNLRRYILFGPSLGAAITHSAPRVAASEAAGSYRGSARTSVAGSEGHHPTASTMVSFSKSRTSAEGGPQ